MRVLPVVLAAHFCRLHLSSCGNMFCFFSSGQLGDSTHFPTAVTFVEVSAAQRGEGPISIFHSPLSAPEVVFGEVPSPPEGQGQDTY